MSNLNEKVALVTGGSRGIGAAIAKRLAADGASVAITYASDAAAASDVVKAIESKGGKAVAIQANASDKEAVEAAVEKAVATLGRLDVLVNDAGTAIPKTFEETTQDEVDRMFNINVRGTMIATRAAIKHMKRGGRIISIGSCVGERVTPGLVAYAATKGAVKLFTQGLAREVGSRGITVNTVEPGPIDTALNPAASDWAAPQKAAMALDRYGTVEEVAALVAFLPARSPRTSRARASPWTAAPTREHRQHDSPKFAVTCAAAASKLKRPTSARTRSRHSGGGVDLGRLICFCAALICSTTAGTSARSIRCSVPSAARWMTAITFRWSMATFTFRFFPRDVVVTSIFSRKDGRRSRSILARNGRTVLLNLSPNRRRISPVTRSIEISSSPRLSHSVATISADGYKPSRSAIVKP